MAIIRDVYELDPYANAVYLFCKTLGSDPNVVNLSPEC